MQFVRYLICGLWCVRSFACLEALKTNEVHDLLVRFQNGEVQASEALYKKVFRYTLPRVFNFHDAEEITQDVLFLVYQKPIPTNPSPGWYYQIAKCKIVDYRRRDNAIKRGADRTRLFLQDIEGSLQNTDFQDLEEALGLLSESDQSLVTRRLQGFTYQQLSKEYDEPEINIRRRYHRAEQRLKYLLQRW